MPTQPNEHTQTQQICLSAAVVGLLGSATDTLRCTLAKEEALRLLELVSTNRAAFVWTVEAHRGGADIRLELAHADGTRVQLAQHAIALELQPAGGHHAAGLH